MLFIRKLFLLVAVAISFGTASAEIITVISPSAAGGGASMMAKSFAFELEKKLGTTVVVDYKTGADGRVAAAHLKNAGDQPVLLLSFTSTYVNNQDVIVGKDVLPIAFLGKVPLVVAARKDFPYDSLQEVLKKSPKNKRYFYGTVGIGSSMHLTMLDVVDVSGRDIFDHVTYKGTSIANIDLLGGRLDMVVGGTASIASFVQNGDMKVLGVFSKSPSSILPNSEAIGYDRIPSAAAVGTILVNANTKPETVAKLTEAINEIVRSPAWAEVRKIQDIQPYVQTEKTVLDQTLKNIRVLEEIIKKNNIEIK